MAGLVRLSPDATEARTVHVVADLRCGVVFDARYPTTLDGILASAYLRRHLGDDYSGNITPDANYPLPIARLTVDASDGWVWGATSAQWDREAADEDVRWWHKRLDVDTGQRVVEGGMGGIKTTQGRHRAYRSPLLVTVTATIWWYALGVPDRIDQLLSVVTSLGRKRSQGEGQVARWTVTDEGPADTQKIVLADGRVGRPFPASWATALGLTAPALSRGATRPPYWHPENQGEVIGPWAYPTVPPA